MRWVLAALATLAAAFSMAAEPRTVLLADQQMQLDAQEVGEYWFDAEGKASLEDVVARRGVHFQPTQPGQIHSLGDHGSLWLHWRMSRGRGEENGWLLVFPMPSLDAVTLYQQNDRYQWTGHTAGDTMAVATWSEPGRYPHFRLELPMGQVRDVYARIRHLTPANFPVQLQSEATYDQRIQVEYLGLGLAFGALLLLIVACLAQAFVYRDAVYAWYAVYAFVTALGVAAYTGAAAHLLWPGFGALGDAPQGMLALAAGAAALLFIRNLIGIAGRHRFIDQMVLAAGFAGLALIFLYPVLPKIAGVIVVATFIAAVSLANTWIAFAAWRRGDAVGGWVLIAYVPLTLAVGMVVLRMAGWLPVSFGTQYAIVVAMALEVPLLLVGLSIRSRERHGAQIREEALSSQDALTGLLAEHLFHDRLLQVVSRYRRYRDNAAVVFVDLVNHGAIKARYGSSVAEQSLLRSVIKLRRLVRDVDTVSRIGEARFGIVMEGVEARAAVTERAARLIAAGLMPLKGLKPEVTLQFHIGAVLLEERCLDADALVAALDELLGNMSPRTRRPIRFLEHLTTEPQPLEADSSLLADDSAPPASQPATGDPLRSASSQ